MEILRTGLVSFARGILHLDAADSQSAADRFRNPRNIISSNSTTKSDSPVPMRRRVHRIRFAG